MKILVSNDDGIGSRGINALESGCRRVGDVSVVAPDRQQSAASSSLTIFRPLRPRQLDDSHFQVDGTPTDCVLLALSTLLAEKPDFVFSGVNHGTNMGEDVLYSGTVAAAIEGLTAGVPGIAFSYAGDDTRTIDTQQQWIDRLIADIVAVDDFPAETLLNINLPPVPGDQIKGVKVTTLGSRVYADSLHTMQDPWGHEIFWIGGGTTNWTGGAESDFRAIADGYISVTPLHIDMTNYRLLETVRTWGLGG